MHCQWLAVQTSFKLEKVRPGDKENRNTASSCHLVGGANPTRGVATGGIEVFFVSSCFRLFVRAVLLVHGFLVWDLVFFFFPFCIFYAVVATGKLGVAAVDSSHAVADGLLVGAVGDAVTGTAVVALGADLFGGVEVHRLCSFSGVLGRFCLPVPCVISTRSF